MRQATAIAAAAILCAALATIGQTGSQPPHSSPGSPHGNTDPKPVPEAVPEDVESIDAIMAAMYAGLSGAKGEERDWDRLRSLFLPEARYIAARPMQDMTVAWFLSADDFIAMTKKTFERGGYFEEEIGRRTEQFGAIAHVWSTYEARYAAEDDPHSRGIYSIQLLNDGSRWWIVNAYWAFEREDLPIPEKYLDGAPE